MKPVWLLLPWDMDYKTTGRFTIHAVANFPFSLKKGEDNMRTRLEHNTK